MVAYDQGFGIGAVLGEALFVVAAGDVQLMEILHHVAVLVADPIVGDGLSVGGAVIHVNGIAEGREQPVSQLAGDVGASVRHKRNELRILRTVVFLHCFHCVQELVGSGGFADAGFLEHIRTVVDGAGVGSRSLQVGREAVQGAILVDAGNLGLGILLKHGGEVRHDVQILTIFHQSAGLAILFDGGFVGAAHAETEDEIRQTVAGQSNAHLGLPVRPVSPFDVYVGSFCVSIVPEGVGHIFERGGCGEGHRLADDGVSGSVGLIASRNGGGRTGGGRRGAAGGSAAPAVVAASAEGGDCEDRCKNGCKNLFTHG